MSQEVEKGSKVKVHYTGSLEDGTVFDSSKDRDPLHFTAGEGQLIPGFENAVMGMKSGESKKISIPPAEAYGEPVKELIKAVDRSYFPSHIEPKLNMQLKLGENEDTTIVTITDIKNDKITLDANHPLAGKTLNFEIEIVEIS